MDDGIVSKKRRKLKGLGYMRELNHKCWYIKLKDKKSEEISCRKSEKVTINVIQIMANFGRF